MNDFIFEENSISNLSTDDKRQALSNAVLQTKIQAEFDKLNNEQSKLISKNIFSRLFSKLDGSAEYKMENINFKRYVINDKLERSSKNKLDQDINQLLADIELFMEDNKSNDLILDEINQLNSISNCIYNNFTVDSKQVENFITERKQIFLPVLTRKLTKSEQLKSDSIKYLNKQGYNK